MNFNPTVDLGDVLVISGLLLGGIKYYADMHIVKFKVETIWEWYENRYSDFPPRTTRNPQGD